MKTVFLYIFDWFLRPTIVQCYLRSDKYYIQTINKYEKALNLMNNGSCLNRSISNNDRATDTVNRLIVIAVHSCCLIFFFEIIRSYIQIPYTEYYHYGISLFEFAQLRKPDIKTTEICQHRRSVLCP